MMTTTATRNTAEQRAEILTHEAVLLDRWRKGDEDALNQLIQENLPVAERLALKLTKNPSEADDVVSEALLRVFRAAAKFNGGCQFKTWMHRIVVNCVLDIRRRKGLRLTSFDEIHAEDDGSLVQMQLAYEGSDALDDLIQSEQIDSICRSIPKLDDDQQKLIYLFHRQGLGYERISEELCAPIGTVKSRLHRARQSVKEIIEREERVGDYAAKIHSKAS